MSSASLPRTLTASTCSSSRRCPRPWACGRASGPRVPGPARRSSTSSSRADALTRARPGPGASAVHRALHLARGGQDALQGLLLFQWCRGTLQGEACLAEQYAARRSNLMGGLLLVLPVPLARRCWSCSSRPSNWTAEGCRPRRVVARPAAGGRAHWERHGQLRGPSRWMGPRRWWEEESRRPGSARAPGAGEPQPAGPAGRSRRACVPGGAAPCTKKPEVRHCSPPSPVAADRLPAGDVPRRGQRPGQGALREGIALRPRAPRALSLDLLCSPKHGPGPRTRGPSRSALPAPRAGGRRRSSSCISNPRSRLPALLGWSVGFG